MWFCKLKRCLGRFLLIFSIVAIVSCANSSQINIEEAQYAIDRHDWDQAIYLAKSVLESEPSNIKAALVLAAAYAGKGGFRVVDLAEVIANDIHRGRIMGALHNAMLMIGSVDMEQIRNAIYYLLERVNPLPQFGHLHFIDYQFDVGLLLVIEGHVLPTIIAQPLLDGPIDVNQITQEIADRVQQDLVNFDNYLLNAGFTEDDDILVHSRETYCVLENASGRTDGFDLEVLRDLTLCQLSPNNGADLGPDDFQSGKVTACTDFDYNACSSVDTSDTE